MANSVTVRGANVEELEIVDSPCWGSPTRCGLTDLLQLLDRNDVILFESEDYLVLNKSPDLRMDGGYPATVLKLLTYWYPPESLRDTSDLLKALENVNKANDISDNELRHCHQLDYATSGVLLFGRNRKAASRACAAFRERTTDKIYLALVDSHVEVDCPTLALTMDDLYKEIRRFDKQVADRRKTNRKEGKTFNGYQPPSSVFLKWKSFYGRGGKRPRDATMIQRIEEQISQQDLDAMSSMAWAQVKKNDQWKSVFENVAKHYNDALLEEEGITRNTSSTEKMELPTIFRLKQDADPTVFYVNASLAQQEDKFAMQIHPQSLKQESDKVPQLDFKLAITRCRVLSKASLCGAPVTKLELRPLTGRRHQLRCHMLVLGAPIVGDVTYQGRSDLVERMCLHACRLIIPHLLDVKTTDPFSLSADSSSFEVRLV
jgi:23S rRNA-/tRNA-specific pseudouridylate synthase